MEIGARVIRRCYQRIRDIVVHHFYIKLGKKTADWNKFREKLKEEYQDRGITTCELRLPGCWNNNALSFAHRHKRSWYLGQSELLGDFNQTILACIPCHNKIEFNKTLTEKLFQKLRGE